jgi:hypothetical protein
MEMLYVPKACDNVDSLQIISCSFIPNTKSTLAKPLDEHPLTLVETWAFAHLSLYHAFGHSSTDGRFWDAAVLGSHTAYSRNENAGQRTGKPSEAMEGTSPSLMAGMGPIPVTGSSSSHSTHRSCLQLSKTLAGEFCANHPPVHIPRRIQSTTLSSRKRTEGRSWRHSMLLSDWQRRNTNSLLAKVLQRGSCRDFR